MTNLCFLKDFNFPLSSYYPVHPFFRKLVCWDIEIDLFAIRKPVIILWMYLFNLSSSSYSIAVYVNHRSIFVWMSTVSMQGILSSICMKFENLVATKRNFIFTPFVIIRRLLRHSLCLARRKWAQSGLSSKSKRVTGLHSIDLKKITSPLKGCAIIQSQNFWHPQLE